MDISQATDTGGGQTYSIYERDFWGPDVLVMPLALRLAKARTKFEATRTGVV